MSVPPPPGMEAAPNVSVYGPPLAAPMPPRRRNSLLVWGSILRMVGAVIGGIAVIWLGLLVASPTGLIDPLNPFGFFTVMGVIIVLGGLSAILVGVGWALQTWGVGLVLSFDRGE